jgi:hypothetical protein
MIEEQATVAPLPLSFRGRALLLTTDHCPPATVFPAHPQNMSPNSRHFRFARSPKLDLGFVWPTLTGSGDLAISAQSARTGDSPEAEKNKRSDFIHSETRFVTLTTCRINQSASKFVSLFCDFYRFFVDFVIQTGPSRPQNACFRPHPGHQLRQLRQLRCFTAPMPFFETVKL